MLYVHYSGTCRHHPYHLNPLLTWGLSCCWVSCASQRCGCALLQNGPIKHVVVLVVERAEQYTKQLAQVHVVRRLLEPQPTAVVQVHSKLCRIALVDSKNRQYRWDQNTVYGDRLICKFIKSAFPGSKHMEDGYNFKWVMSEHLTD